MFKPAIWSAAIVVVLGSGLVLAQSPGQSVADTINARRGLMNQLTTLQGMIDTRVASGEYPPELYDLSQAAAASFDAFALLLPEETNLLGGAPAVEGAETTAAAAIWDDLPAFQQLVHSAAANARSASEAEDLAAFRTSWAKVEQSCTSCHETYVFYDPFAAMN